ncbi:MAG TPA: HypC/HybG/HupF family hydrogenase formation chaperone [Candidatus Limnocylindrales bacterium]
MCIAYPGQVLEIDNGMALVETDQRRRRASLLLVPETAVGDWVVVSAGTVLRVLDPEEANEIRTMLDEAARADAALRGVTPPDGG